MAAYTPQYMLRTAMPSSTTSGGSGSTSASTASGTASSKSKGSKGSLSRSEMVKAIMNSTKDHTHIAAVLNGMMAGGGGRKARRKRTPLGLDEKTKTQMKEVTVGYYDALANIQTSNHKDYLIAKNRAEHDMFAKKYLHLKMWIDRTYPNKPTATKGVALDERQKMALKAYGALNRLDKNERKTSDSDAIIAKYEQKEKFLKDDHFRALQPILKKYYLAKANALAEDDTKKCREDLRAALKEKKQEMAGWRQHHNIAPRQKPPRQMRQSLAFQAGLFDLHESCEDTDDDDY